MTHATFVFKVMLQKSEQDFDSLVIEIKLGADQCEFSTAYGCNVKTRIIPGQGYMMVFHMNAF